MGNGYEELTRGKSRGERRVIFSSSGAIRTTCDFRRLSDTTLCLKLRGGSTTKAEVCGGRQGAGAEKPPLDEVADDEEELNIAAVGVEVRERESNAMVAGTGVSGLPSLQNPQFLVRLSRHHSPTASDGTSLDSPRPSYINTTASRLLFSSSLRLGFLQLFSNGEGNRELWEEEKQDPHSLCEVWPSQLSSPEEPLLGLCLPSRPQEDM
nr:large subunit ribosomal protein L37e [Ipomoea batatas]GMC51847.1 large subunit ribosomal protein L37e [Ipomoea batatas]